MTSHHPKKPIETLTDQEMDQLLAALPLELPSARLRAHVLDLVKGPVTQKDRWWWHFGILWQPAAMLAGSALFGLGLGTAWPLDPPAPTPIWEEAASIVFGPIDEEWP
ncbi:MAG: hypothetical protein HQL75_14555 [Magnetococcales bacterium]|nr:hypothetical protein [Magnetococcales bacterium]